MRDPAGEEQSVIRLSQVFGCEAKIGKEVTGMVKRHDDHNQAAHDIERNDPAWAGSCRRLPCSRLGRTRNRDRP